MVSEKVNISQQELVSETSLVASRRGNQYIAAVIATFGGFIAGTCLAWTSPAEQPLKNKFFGYTTSDDQFAWIGSFMPLGAIAGSIITAPAVDIVGRKSLILILTVPCIVGWAAIAFSVSVVMICLGRFLTGVASGSYCILAPMYTAEIGEKEIRGSLGTYFQLQITIGILFCYVIGSFVNLFLFTIICAVFPVIYLCMMCFIPETPFFHALKRNVRDAQSSLSWFRGPLYDGKHEIAVIQKTIEDDEADKVPFIRGFQTTPALKGLIIGLGIMFLQQFSGCNAVIFYAASIFRDAGTSMNASLSAIIIGTIQVIATWVATMVVDKVGRRILLLLSIIIMSLSTFSLGLYFYLKQDALADVDDIAWLPLLSLSTYIIIFSLGFGPIPWMLMAEIFPSKIRSSACSLAGLTNWLCVFIVTKLFPVLKVQLGPGITFWLFTVCSTFGIIFVIFMVPETKGKTLQEVQEMLGSERRNISSLPSQQI